VFQLLDSVLLFQRPGQCFALSQDDYLLIKITLHALDVLNDIHKLIGILYTLLGNGVRLSIRASGK